MVSPYDDALVAEATRRSGVIWVALGERPARLVWHLWRDGSAYVLSGPGEQKLPGIEAAEHAIVVVPSHDTGARLVEWQAAVRRIEPGTEEWGLVVPALVAARLNLADAATAPTRWAQTCVLARLAPGRARPDR